MRFKGGNIMRFKVGNLTDFKLYKKPKLMRYEYGKGFIVSVGLFRFLDSGGMYDRRTRKEVELEISIHKLYKLIETDKGTDYNYFYKSLWDFRTDWEEIVLKSINIASGYTWIICDEDTCDHDNWTININQLYKYYPWVQEEVLSTSRLLNEVFDIEALGILEKILNYITVEEEDNKDLKFEFSRKDELTLVAEGVYKYKYKLGDSYYERIPEANSINNTPERIGIASDNSLVKDDFFNRFSGVRDQLKELFVQPYKVGEVDKYEDPKYIEERKKSESKGFLSRIIDLFL